jgi:APA family basic amino acid/polyamine antiporter
MLERLLATKDITTLLRDAEHGQGLKRALGAFDLVMLGIGCVIGTGIFVLTGRAAAANAGPAVALSFALAGLASSFAALCYSEMASMLPVSGSAYTYTYATLGELVAWMIGWDLILEYLVGAATVSVGWSGYLTAFVHDVVGIDLPWAWVTSPLTFDAASRTFAPTGAILNAPAVGVALVATVVLLFGVRESARINAVVVAVKVAVVLLFLAFAGPYVNVHNWQPFIPDNQGAFGRYGWSGIFQGATMVFFSYIGFDAVSTAAQESKNPQRDLPIGIIASLAICTVLYIAVSLVLTGVVPYGQLSVPHPIALGVQATGMRWLMTAVEVGALAGLTSVLLVLLMGQPRIFLAMAQDGLFPPIASHVHARYGTPWTTTLISGGTCSIAAGLLPIEVLGELTSIGTLFAFVLVAAGVLILRIRRPDLPRKFRFAGGNYLVPLLAMGTSGLLMATATTYTLVRLVLWMALGLLVYGAYGYRHSKLRAGAAAPLAAP